MSFDSQTEIPLRLDARDVPQWDHSADVVVVGFGCAGASAAIEASRAGARVCVLEVAGGPGGTSALSGGLVYLGGGTPIQRACGFEDSTDDMFRYMMAACGPDPDEAMIAAYCEGSLEHFDWLDACGVPFRASFFPDAHEPFETDDGLTYSGSEHVHPFCEIARPAPRGHIPRKVRNKGGLLMQHLVATAEAAGIEVHTGTKVMALVVEGDGRIVGVVARQADGVCCVQARRGVVLTAGGFVYNEDMLAAYAPTLSRCRFKVGTEYDDGSGIRLGIAAGGHAIRMGAGDISLALFPPNDLRRGLFVNRFGQRFLNEDAYMGRAGEFFLLHQEGRGWLIVDDAVFQQPKFFPAAVAAVGDTVAELEAELGLPAPCLQDTVALYNRYAERGEDPLFHKGAGYLQPLTEPPFGAIDLGTDAAMYSVFTLGGLHIDPDGRVLRAAGEPVPGLYAAGRTTSGIAKQGYSSGMSLGDASFFGRRAGLHAAGSA
ncbi:MAG: FAD-dependent oxidoreductase [Myxococcota bacterium]